MQELNNHHLKDIEEFLMGNLLGVELEKFNQELKTNIVLRKELTRQQELIKEPINLINQEPPLFLKKINQELQEEGIFEPDQELDNGKVIPLQSRFSIKNIAKFAAVFIGILGCFWVFKEKENTKVFASLEAIQIEVTKDQRNQSSVVSLGSEDSIKFNLIPIYKNRLDGIIPNQRELENINEYIKSSPDDYFVKCFYAVSLIESHKSGIVEYTQALKILESLDSTYQSANYKQLARFKELYNSDLKWFLANTHRSLKNNGIESKTLKLILEISCQDEGGSCLLNQEKARERLKELQQ